jgi:hypothetical protein
MLQSWTEECSNKISKWTNSAGSKKSFGGGEFQTKTARNCFLQLLQIP